MVFQVSGSYRPAIVALIVFFVLGAGFLLRLDPERGIREAGNTPPVGGLSGLDQHGTGWCPAM